MRPFPDKTVVVETDRLVSRPWHRWIGDFVAAFNALTTSIVTSAITAATLVLSGLLTLNGGQIKFPATQVPSTDANTLDDYEEGTWTPVLRFGTGTTGITYTNQQGTYIKVGRRVTLQARVTLSAKGSSTGTADLSGVPFTPRSGSPVPSYVGACIATNMALLDPPVTPRILGNGSLISLFDWPAAAGVAALDDTNFTNTSDLLLTLEYFADA